jgi:hypothetical protein
MKSEISKWKLTRSIPNANNFMKKMKDLGLSLKNQSNLFLPINQIKEVKYFKNLKNSKISLKLKYIKKIF